MLNKKIMQRLTFSGCWRMVNVVRMRSSIMQARVPLLLALPRSVYLDKRVDNSTQGQTATTALQNECLCSVTRNGDCCGTTPRPRLILGIEAITSIRRSACRVFFFFFGWDQKMREEMYRSCVSKTEWKLVRRPKCILGKLIMLISTR